MLAPSRRNMADCGVLPGSQKSHQTEAMSRSIAIVEDEPAIRENYADAFRREGYRVAGYGDRQSALAAFENRLPDLVLIDVSLGDEPEGGFELCRALRARSTHTPLSSPCRHRLHRPIGSAATSPSARGLRNSIETRSNGRSSSLCSRVRVRYETPQAYAFETGTNRWRTFDEWPSRSAATRSLYLREGGELSFDPPARPETSSPTSVRALAVIRSWSGTDRATR